MLKFDSKDLKLTITLFATSIFFFACEIKKERADNFVPPVESFVDFKFEYKDNGTVNFLNLSKNVASFDWEFGDFTFNGNTRDTSHAYLSNGEYKVKLKAKKASGDSLFVEKVIQVSNKKSMTDTVKYACKENVFHLKSDFGDLCSAYSEFGSVLLRKNKLGREYAFWFAFRRTADWFDQEELSFVINFIINAEGNYEFVPPGHEHQFTVNNAWLLYTGEVYQNGFKYVDIQKIQLTIIHASEESISGSIVISLDDGKKYYGNFKNLKVEKTDQKLL